MKRNYNPLKVKRHRPYTVETLAALYGVKPNTVRQWIKKHGLPVIPNTYPTLLHWEDIRRWMTGWQTRRRWKNADNEMSCLKCQGPRKIVDGTFWIETTNTAKITAHGDCVECGKTLNSFGVRRDSEQITANFASKPYPD